MSKAVKKVRKAVKSIAKPGLDIFKGITGQAAAESANKAAKAQMAATEEAARRAAADAAENARASAQQVALDQERQALTRDAQEASQLTTEAPTVQLTEPVEGSGTTERRRRYRSPTGGTGSSGASVRV